MRKTTKNLVTLSIIFAIIFSMIPVTTLMAEEVDSDYYSDEETDTDYSDEDTDSDLSDEDTDSDYSDEDTDSDLSDEETDSDYSDEETDTEYFDEDTNSDYSTAKTVTNFSTTKTVTSTLTAESVTNFSPDGSMYVTVNESSAGQGILYVDGKSFEIAKPRVAQYIYFDSNNTAYMVGYNNNTYWYNYKYQGDNVYWNPISNVISLVIDGSTVVGIETTTGTVSTITIEEIQSTYGSGNNNSEIDYNSNTNTNTDNNSDTDYNYEEEQRKLAAEQKQREEQEKLAAEQKQREEQEKLAEEQKQREEQEKLAAEQKQREEQEKLEEQKKLEEDQKYYEEQKRIEEQQILQEEQNKETSQTVSNNSGSQATVFYDNNINDTLTEKIDESDEVDSESENSKKTNSKKEDAEEDEDDDDEKLSIKKLASNIINSTSSKSKKVKSSAVSYTDGKIVLKLTFKDGSKKTYTVLNSKRTKKLKQYGIDKNKTVWLLFKSGVLKAWNYSLSDVSKKVTVTKKCTTLQARNGKVASYKLSDSTVKSIWSKKKIKKALASTTKTTKKSTKSKKAGSSLLTTIKNVLTGNKSHYMKIEKDGITRSFYNSKGKKLDFFEFEGSKVLYNEVEYTNIRSAAFNAKGNLLMITKKNNLLLVKSKSYKKVVKLRKVSHFKYSKKCLARYVIKKDGKKVKVNKL